ncbi:hypothetical protein L2E82_37023 [Cichorium intybus]|uniref:Uncharacterized protein n=1 Tax=Cichorium intybus TaxID=13427 RepID=A0ACB9AE80_CICIN|nr:hypothetical protein L2E82_37023 [Cichorium intybus]
MICLTQKSPKETWKLEKILVFVCLLLNQHNHYKTFIPIFLFLPAWMDAKASAFLNHDSRPNSRLPKP